MAPSYSTLLYFMILGVTNAVSLGNQETRNLNTTSDTSLPTQRYMALSNKDQGYVTGGSLVSFDDDLLAEEKSDILDSLLFAELSASNVYDKTESFSKWYHLYISVLQEIGWNIKSLGFQRYDPDQKSPYTIINKVWDFLSPQCETAQQEVSRRSFSWVWQS